MNPYYDCCEDCKADGDDWYENAEGELVSACEECGLIRRDD